MIPINNNPAAPANHDWVLPYQEWTPPSINSLVTCLQDKNFLHLSSDPIFCSPQDDDSSTTSDHSQNSQGITSRLWKAFKITVGIGSTDKGSAKQQWHEHAERNALPEEPNVQSSMYELKRRLIALQQRKSFFEKNLTQGQGSSLKDVFKSIELTWERQWAFLSKCGLGLEDPKAKGWCEKTSEALISDVKLLETRLEDQVDDVLLTILQNSQLSQFKTLFSAKGVKISPEMLLATQSQALKNEFEITPPSQLEWLSQITTLFDEGSNITALTSLKDALACAKEVQEKVITPFSKYKHALDVRKYTGLNGMESRMQQAVDDFKTILSQHLSKFESGKGTSTARSSILIPGGLSGSNALLSKLMPFLTQSILQATKEYNLDNLKELLNDAESWIYSASKIAYYEIEPDSQGTYIFRIYYGRPNAAHPKETDPQGNEVFQSSVSVTGVSKDALLSDVVLHTLLEPQLIGDLIREVSDYTFDISNPKNAAPKNEGTPPPQSGKGSFPKKVLASLQEGALFAWKQTEGARGALFENAQALGLTLWDSLRGAVAGKQANWDERHFEESLFKVLGGKLEKTTPTSHTIVTTSSSPEWDALLSVLKHGDLSTDQSEQLIMATRLAFLHHFCQNTDPEAIGKNDQALSIASAVHKSVARWGLSLQESGKLNHNDLKAFHLILSKASQVISRAKEIEAARTRKEAASVSLAVRRDESPFGSIELPRVEPVKDIKTNTADSIYRPVEQIANWHPTDDTWTKDLHNFSELLLNHIDQGNFLAVIDGVELIAEQSENLLSLIDNIPTTEVEPTISAISDMAQAYFSAHFDSGMPTHPDARGFAAIMVLLELAEELRQKLPEELGLGNSTLYGHVFSHYLGSSLEVETPNDKMLMSFRLYDPKWDMRIKRIALKNENNMSLRLLPMMPAGKEETLHSLGVVQDRFGASGEMGSGLWRYRNSFSFGWPLGIEADRVENAVIATAAGIQNGHFSEEIFAPLFNDTLPYRKAFAAKFPKIASTGTRFEQIAAAYEDPTESCLPKSYYALRRLRTIATYLLWSPFVPVDGPVKNRNTYVNQFHAVHTPDINIPIPQFVLDRGWMNTPYFEVMKEKVRFFSEVRGIDKEFLDSHPEIAKCSAHYIDSCHRFTHTHDPFNNKVLNHIASKLQNKDRHWNKSGWSDIIKKYVPRSDQSDQLNINQAMVSYLLSKPHRGGLEWKDFVRLSATFSKSNTQIASTLSFFSNRLHLFEGNEKKEWRSLLQQALFEPGLLTAALSEPNQREDISRALDFFCDKGYRYFHSLQKNDEAAYFLDLSLMITRYLEKTLQQGMNPDNIKFLHQTSLLTDLRKDIAIEGTLPERHKGPLAGVLARHLLDDYKLYSDEELEEIIEAVVLYNRYPSPQSSNSRQIRDAIVKGMRRIAPQIKQLMSDETKRDALLKKLVGRALPQTAVPEFTTDAESLRYLSKNLDLKIDLLEGRILKNGLGDQTLPSEVLKDPQYRAVFGDEEQWVKIIGLNAWEFIDQSGYHCRITKGENGPQILRQLKDNQWYRYVPSSLFSKAPASTTNHRLAALEGIEDRTSPLGSLQFIDGLTHWYLEGPPSELLLLDTKTNQPRYKVTLAHSPTISAIGGKDSVHAIYDLSQNPPLQLVNIYNEEFRYAFLENMDDLRHVTLWKDGSTGALKRIELPRYRRLQTAESSDENNSLQQQEGLSFTIKNNRPYCDQIPEFYLESRQHSHWLPQLKSLLVLRNADGDQKIILPFWEPQAQAGLSTRPNFQDPRSKSIKHHNYVVLEKAKEKANFVGIDIQANLYQALLLQAQHRYSEAAEVLASYGHSSKAYTHAQRRVFESVINFAIKQSRDEQPDAYIPAMQAISLLIKDHMAHGSDMEKIDPHVKTVFLTYYKNRSESGHLRINDEHTALVARYLLEKNHQLDTNVKDQYLKLSEIDPLAAHRGLSEYAHKIMSSKANTFFNLGSTFLENLSTNKNRPSPYEQIIAVPQATLIEWINLALSPKKARMTTGLMLQPDALEFAAEFPSLIKTLLKGTDQQRKMIEDRCHVMLGSDQNVAALKQILIAFAEHPQPFSQALSSINMEKELTPSDFETLVPILIDTAKTVASKDVSPVKSPPDNLNPNFNFQTILNLFNSANPQFSPNKFSSKQTNQAGPDASSLTIPAPVPFTPLMDEWKQLLVQNHEALDISKDPVIAGYEKILSANTSNESNLSPRYKEESHNLIHSIKAYLSRHRGTLSFENPQARTQMIEQRDVLRNRILTDERELADRELEILMFFNRATTDKEATINVALKQMGGEIRARALPELILLFTRRELPTLAQEIGLSEHEVKIGSRLLANYLTVAKHRDSMKFGLLPALDKLASLKPTDYDTTLEQELLEEISSQLNVKPQVDPEAEPAVAGFEFFNRLLLRGEQWEKIQELQQFYKKAIQKLDGSPKHLVQKLEMGFGKTFLMMPICGFTSATGDRMSMALVPKELIEDFSKEIGDILGKTYKQLLQTLDFDRNTEFTIERLENIFRTLSDVKKNRQFLMMTPQSVRSFMLKFIETWWDYNEALMQPDQVTVIAEYEQKIALMQKTLLLWQDADILFDEKHLIQNSKQRLSFAMGTSDMLPVERRGLVVELYRVLTSEAFRKKVDLKLEFLPSDTSNGKNAFTPSYYEETVKPAIARMMLDRLTEKVKDANEISSFVKDFPFLGDAIKKWSSNELEHVYNFIVNKDTNGEGYAFVKSLKDEKLRQILGLLKGQLNELLPLTLNRNYAERYGFHHPEDLLAGPYSGSNTPNIGSQFTDPWEIALYTINAHFKRGDYRQLVEQIITLAREQAKKEAVTRGCLVDETNAFIQFEEKIGKRTGITLFQDNGIEKISSHIKNDPNFQLYLIENYILPEIQEYPQELAATSQAFSLLFQVTKGFTGTPWNWQTYPPGSQVSAIAETDGATLVPLYKKSRDRVFEVSCNQSNRAASLFDKNPSFRDAQAFIDSGGILKGIPHEDVAKQLFTLPWFKDAYDGVVFFDEKGNKKILEKDRLTAVSFDNSHVPLQKRFTFYDQKHSTGTNIKQLPRAKGVISASKQMLGIDLMQGCKRFRQFNKGQQMDIVVLDEDAAVMKDVLGLPKEKPIDFDGVISHLWRQQLERVGEENFMAAVHKMQTQLQRPIFELLKDPSKDPKEVAKLLPNATSLFFKNIKDNPFAHYGEPKTKKPKDEVIKANVDKLLKPEIRSLFLNEQELAHLILNQTTIKDWVKLPVNSDHLDDLITVADEYHDLETEMELEQETEQEAEVENEQEQQNEEELALNYWRDPYEHNPQVVKSILDKNGLNILYWDIHQWLKPAYSEYLFDDIFDGIFDGRILVSNNQHYSHRVKGGYTKPIEYMLIHITKQNGKKDYELTLIDTNDASDAANEFKNLNRKIDPSKEGWVLYAVGVGQVQHAGLKIEEKPGHENPELLSLLVQAKFADGEIYYNEDEQKALHNWIEKVGVDKAEKVIHSILKDQPGRRNAYPQSSLGNLIAKIKGKAK